MLKRFPIYLIICLIIGGMNFYITNNVYFSIGLFIIGILIFSLGIDKSINQFFIKEKKTKEAINFISNFIITLSINKNKKHIYKFHLTTILSIFLKSKLLFKENNKII